MEITLSGRSKSTGAASGFIEITCPRSFRRNDLFDNQLADLASRSKLDRLVTRVVEQTTNFSAVIRIDHAREHVEPILRRESGSRCDSPVETRRNRNGESRPRHHPLLR